METYATRQVKKNAQREENLNSYNREYAKNDNRKYIEDELDDYLPQPTPKKYNTYPRQTKDPKYYEDYLLDNDNYDPLLEKDSAKYRAELDEILLDQKVTPQIRANPEKDDLYDDLTQDVEKFKSDLETKSYLKEGGKKKKKSSRKHGRTRSKRTSYIRRRRISHKRRRGSRRK